MSGGARDGWTLDGTGGSADYDCSFSFLVAGCGLRGRGGRGSEDNKKKGLLVPFCSIKTTQSSCSGREFLLTRTQNRIIIWWLLFICVPSRRHGSPLLDERRGADPNGRNQ